MKIRGNESGAETPNFASYFLSALPIAQLVALNLNKNLKIPIRFFIITSSSTIIVNFTTNV